MARHVFFFLLLLPLTNFAQQEQKITFSGYLETYYSYDFNKPNDHLRPDFLYNFKRHNEFSVNLALISSSYQDEHVRSTLGLMLGNYAQFNLAGEPQWAQMVYEASVGFRLTDKLWLDVGVMPSDIGFESAIGASCWHLSRSLLAENSPYFLTGARMSYEANDKLNLMLWATNGWQNIQREHRVQGVGLSFAVDYDVEDKLNLHYANYIGNEDVNPGGQIRVYNNFFAQYNYAQWGFLVGVDAGWETTVFSQVNHWRGATASVRRELNEKWFLAGRVEYYKDKQAVILTEGMKLNGVSANLDYQISPKGLIRIELRQFFGEEAYFEIPGANFSKGNTAVTTSFSIRL
ncbi:porin [Belliella sp. DSM 111904]|uniref:Porin n=1 Tax=Belliella filtrata TaxID=2923435 RepID=A0ABS9V2W8_9BACT|nr:outer membrane beta-barrel protein [Belliella filtrata]MCH7410318.1 porin [Belliella filtrata]